MKSRQCFVSNSSSSSFLIINKTDNPVSIYDVLADFMKRDTENVPLDIAPGENVKEYEDHGDDIENKLRNAMDWNEAVESDKFIVKYLENHH